MNSSTPCKDSDTGLETNLHSTECHECHHHQTVPSTQQTLNEMEFERGIWDAGSNTLDLDAWTMLTVITNK